MFKFPESNKLHIQCDIILCRGGCPEPQCNGERSIKGRDQIGDGAVQLLASTTAFVVEPGDELCKL